MAVAGRNDKNTNNAHDDSFLNYCFPSLKVAVILANSL